MLSHTVEYLGHREYQSDLRLRLRIPNPCAYVAIQKRKPTVDHLSGFATCTGVLSRTSRESRRLRIISSRRVLIISYHNPPRITCKLLRWALIEAPILRLPEPKRLFRIDKDACDYQIGAALFQEGDDRVRHPIGFWRRSFLPAE